ncbi:MAG: endonuclease/exonuclease/phosphatase family protein [Patescibacteria group bacterium]|jgi:endonuclease/exonuclease/phosphatase family metal-dependent hydrolase
MVFSVLNWNIHGTRHYTKTDFNKVTPILGKADADIFCFQEAQELRGKLNNFNRLRALDRVFPKNVNDNNIILSKFPIISSGEIAFPQFADRPLEEALWADIQIENKIIRIYNCHFGILGAGPKQRADQLKLILADSRRHDGPVIICGDFNTTIPPAGAKRKIVQWFHKEANESLFLNGKYFYGDERYVFLDIAARAGFHEATDILKSTWCIPPFGWELFNLKLDWFLVRGVEATKVSLGDYISDHRAILAECVIS